ncbi:hypothetical protein TKK_0011098 [Trichogramma kaykai]
MQYLSPAMTLKKINRPKFINLLFLDTFADEKDYRILERQYNKLIEFDFETVLGKNKDEMSIYEFWSEVYNCKSAGGKYVYRELALFVFNALCLPSSNAVVEWVFSLMNATKTKVRNKMMLTLLNAILRLKVHLYSRNVCCKQFSITENMLKDFVSSNVYATASENSIKGFNEDEKEVLDIVSDEFNIPCLSLQE